MITCKHCNATVEAVKVCSNCGKNPALAPVGKGMTTIVGVVALVVVLAVAAVVFSSELRGCL